MQAFSVDTSTYSADRALRSRRIWHLRARDATTIKITGLRALTRRPATLCLYSIRGNSGGGTISHGQPMERSLSASAQMGGLPSSRCD